MVVWKGRTAAFGRFAVPASVFELLAQELMGQCVVRLLEINAQGEDSAVDAGLGFALKETPVAMPLKDKMPVDALGHFARLLAGGVETEVHQDYETVEGDEQACVLFAAAPFARGRLAGEESGSPALGGNARALGCDDVGGCVGKVAHDLPADRGIGIEEPPEERGAGSIVKQGHWSVIAKSPWVKSQSGFSFGCREWQRVDNWFRRSIAVVT